MHHVFCHDLESKDVKTAQHVAFDEGMHGSADPPPFAKLFWVELDPLALNLNQASVNMDVSMLPLNDVKVMQCPFDACKSNPFGFTLSHCPCFFWAHVSSIDGPLDRLEPSHAARCHQGAFVLQVGKVPTFSCQDVIKAIDHHANQPVLLREIVVCLGTDLRTNSINDHLSLLHMHPVDILLCCCNSVLCMGGGFALFFHFLFPHLHPRNLICNQATTPLVAFTPPDPHDLIHPATDAECKETQRLQNEQMTNEEKALSSFACEKLMCLSNLKEWLDANDTQCTL